MNMNKKGFTLVELLAVIVVLIVISVIAINRISDVMKRNNENAVTANAETLIKQVNDSASTSRLTHTFIDGMYSVQELFELGINISGTKPERGYVSISQGTVTEACLEYEKLSFTLRNGNKNVEKDIECIFDPVTTFAFNNNEDSFFEPKFDGSYKIEIWSGSDKSISGAETYGYYAVGVISLQTGDKLYVSPSGDRSWVYCAGEGGTCSFSGQKTVAYGADTRWATKTATNSVGCNNDQFGGDPACCATKSCYYATNPEPLGVVYKMDNPSGTTEASNLELLISSSSTGANISNTDLSNKHMTCYNCTPSEPGALIEKRTTECVNTTTVADCSKSGSGVIKITYVRET